MKRFLFIIISIVIVLASCTQKAEQSSPKIAEFKADFDNYDRVWVGRDFWAIPMEDWQIHDGRLECVGNRNNMRVNLLTFTLNDKAVGFNAGVRMGLLNSGETNSSAGLSIGVQDTEDPDARAACYFGKGIKLGVTSSGELYIQKQKTTLPEGFDLKDFHLRVNAQPSGDGYTLIAVVTDKQNHSKSLSQTVNITPGFLAMFNDFPEKGDREKGSHFWFDNLTVKGAKIDSKPENTFGPILWSMYTLSRNVVKLTAQMPPLGERDDHNVRLLLKKNKDWEIIKESQIDPNARTATFKLENWDSEQEVQYRLVYSEKDTNGNVRENEYDGTIRRDPEDQALTLGGLTCQYGTGFPYSPLVKHITAQNPDLLYFSGDQIYEANGGYSIIRFPADMAILSYLGKWYMFGWAFGDLMRDRPTICTPDDHDVFQGNLWGEGGPNIPPKSFNIYHGTEGGYVEPAEMINVVHTTQCSHLPDPFDPALMEQNIIPIYMDLVYGRISFAIVSDRNFKSGPNAIAYWQGRQDHVKDRGVDPAVLDSPDLKMLGDRQLEFLDEWVRDWRGADMKVLLSQTVFANIATHHGGEQMVLAADLDSGGWPRTARNKALSIMRKGYVFHIVGDQHIPSLSQYGIDDYRDAGWCFCTPAIYVGYERRFQPERLGWKITDPPEHGLPNTGYYEDGFGNKQYVYAMGNPVDKPVNYPRYKRGQETASGYGLVEFDKAERNIVVHSYHFLADPENPGADDEFAGWPYTLNQFDNDGRKAVGHLPQIEIKGIKNPVIFVDNEKTGELVHAVRILGTSYSAPVYSNDTYTVTVGDPDKALWKTVTSLEPSTNKETVKINF